MTDDEKAYFRVVIDRVFEALGDQDFVMMIPIHKTEKSQVAVFSSLGLEAAALTVTEGLRGMMGIPPEMAEKIDAHREQFLRQMAGEKPH